MKIKKKNKKYTNIALDLQIPLTDKLTGGTMAQQVTLLPHNPKGVWLSPEFRIEVSLC